MVQLHGRVSLLVGLIIVRLDRTAAPNSSVNGTQSDVRCGHGSPTRPSREESRDGGKARLKVLHASALLVANRGYGRRLDLPASAARHSFVAGCAALVVARHR